MSVRAPLIQETAGMGIGNKVKSRLKDGIGTKRSLNSNKHCIANEEVIERVNYSPCRSLV
jgi:hypothetical protein